MAGYRDFINLKYKPKQSDLISFVKVRIPHGANWRDSLGAVGSESSIGTWTEVKAGKYAHVLKLGAKVFSVKKKGADYFAKIAYPLEHFELGNMSQILASISGNIFGMKAIESLRIEDIRWPREIIKSFPGPQYGIEGIRKKLKIKDRPILITVAKPKVGMRTEEHCEVGRQIWLNGLDLLKDDENLAGQKFNKFEDRVKRAAKIRDWVEKEVGERKSYLINITHSNFKEMEKRAKLVASLGWEYAMIDIVTTGFTALHSIRELCEDLGLALHGHRAMHAAFTRNPNHGLSMLCLAEIARLLGVDQLHIGTAGIGKMTENEEESLEIEKAITIHSRIKRTGENWEGVKPVLPVASGGLHPGVVPAVLSKMGLNIGLQVGGGVHGHPNGSGAGAKAFRAAVDAFIEGKSLEDCAKHCPELAQALKLWGTQKVI
ncbi:MAG: type III ribulose-bisphosphate carboxylase [Candidatus Nanoarchaeia archaeon]